MQNSFSQDSLTRIPELDGLRGVAILLVLAFHYINNQLLDATSSLGKVLSMATSFGWVGVDLFFVLSGFLIGSILILNRNSKALFSTFFIRRFVRIVPNYYFFLLLYIAFAFVPEIKDNSFLYAATTIPLWSYFLMIHNFFMAAFESLGSAALSITWSIGIEEQFYLAFPFIVYFTKDKFLPWVLIIIIITAPLIRFQFQHWIPPYVLLPCRMDGLALGALLAFANTHYDLNLFTRKYLLYIVSTLLVTLMSCGVFYFLFQDLSVVKHTAFAFLFTGSLLFALTMKSTWFAAFLRISVLRWIGTISYSLYLFHYFILGVSHQVFSNKRWIGIDNFYDVLITVLALIISVVVAWLVFIKIEKPMVLIGKRVKY